ncbi:hypothetical protein B0H17DRAFT_1200750 [Mycena rosella]|uniref:Uncharacterized protein n=1 Tax=Mycena rosella TaxID=1033263 RepID=A0AAD7DHG0_MYCRO|nr:hypothetical protein B0H17DRAFT_1200750 [Mycena rosella]
MSMSFTPGDEWGARRIHLLHTPRRTQHNTPHEWNNRSSGQQGAAEESLSSSLSLTTHCPLALSFSLLTVRTLLHFDF